jgi:hypothetical protein
MGDQPSMLEEDEGALALAEHYVIEARPRHQAR